MGGFEDAFINFVSDVSPAIWAFLWVLGAGVAFIWVSAVFIRLWRGTTVPGANKVSMGEVAGVLALSALLANYAGTLNTVSHSLGMGDVSFSAISYVSEGSSLGKFAKIVNSAMTFAAMMGGVYGFKGLVMLHSHATGGANQGQDLVWKGIVHIISGGLLVQIAALISGAAASASV